MDFVQNQISLTALRDLPEMQTAFRWTMEFPINNAELSTFLNLRTKSVKVDIVSKIMLFKAYETVRGDTYEIGIKTLLGMQMQLEARVTAFDAPEKNASFQFEGHGGTIFHCEMELNSGDMKDPAAIAEWQIAIKFTDLVVNTRQGEYKAKPGVAA
jgi:hypothetical protein